MRMPAIYRAVCRVFGCRYLEDGPGRIDAHCALCGEPNPNIKAAEPQKEESTMSNKFLAFLTTAEKDVVHVVEAAPAIAVGLVKLLTDGKAVAPEVKTAISAVLSAGEQLVVAVGGAAALGAKNLALDEAGVVAATNFIKVFLANYPVIQKAAGVLVADAEQTVKQAAA